MTHLDTNFNLDLNNGTDKRTLVIFTCAQKTMASSNYNRHADFWRNIGTGPRFSSCAIHLYFVLREKGCLRIF